MQWLNLGEQSGEQRSEHGVSKQLEVSGERVSYKGEGSEALSLAVSRAFLETPATQASMAMADRWRINELAKTGFKFHSRMS